MVPSQHFFKDQKHITLSHPLIFSVILFTTASDSLSQSSTLQDPTKGTLQIE
jgi:hypothetical protein